MSVYRFGPRDKDVGLTIVIIPEPVCSEQALDDGWVVVSFL